MVSYSATEDLEVGISGVVGSELGWSMFSIIVHVDQELLGKMELNQAKLCGVERNRLELQAPHLEGHRRVAHHSAVRNRHSPPTGTDGAAPTSPGSRRPGELLSSDIGAQSRGSGLLGATWQGTVRPQL